MPQQLHEQRTFAGGMTDNPKHGDASQCSFINNLFITQNKSLKVREGCRLLLNDITNLSTPVSALSFVSDEVLAYAGGFLYRASGTEFEAIEEIFSGDNSLEGFSQGVWQNQLFCARDLKRPVKVFKDRIIDPNTNEPIDTWKSVTVGLPQVGSEVRATGVSSSGGIPGTAAYLYAFVYKYTYRIGNEVFVDYSPVRVIRAKTGDGRETIVPVASGSGAVTITSIPALVNDTDTNDNNDTNYDLENVEVEIYRTVDGGTVFYKVTALAHNASSYTDTSTDDTLSNSGETLYTTGGIPDYDAPPKCRYIHILDNTAYYAHIEDTGDVKSSSVVQSVPGAPSAAPAANLIEVDDEIVGMSSIQSVPLIFCRNSVYRIEGVYEGDGSGSPRAIRISDTAGCVDNNSIVQAKNLIYWCGNDRIYASDGYKTMPLSDHIESTYQAIVQNTATLKGVYFEEGERIMWTVYDSRLSEDSQPTFGDNTPNGLLVLDVRNRGSQGAFVFYSGDFESFNPSSLLYAGNRWFRGDARGVIFEHNLNDTSDIAYVSAERDLSLWSDLAIKWELHTLEHNFGSDAIKKKVGRLGLTGVSGAKTAVDVMVEIDGEREVPMTPIIHRGTFVWGDPTFLWGDITFKWGGLGLFNISRRQPSASRRFTYLRHKFKSVPLLLFNSVVLGKAVYENGAFVLPPPVDPDAPARVWPPSVVSDFLRIGNEEYRISHVIGNALYIDSLITFPSGELDFEIWGLSKGQDMNLVAITQTYSISARTQDHTNE